MNDIHQIDEHLSYSNLAGIEYYVSFLRASFFELLDSSLYHTIEEGLTWWTEYITMLG